jgi:hypothetical protein
MNRVSWSGNVMLCALPSTFVVDAVVRMACFFDGCVKGTACSLKGFVRPDNETKDMAL